MLLVWALVAAGALALVFSLTIAVQSVAAAAERRQVVRIEADAVWATEAVHAITADAQARMVQLLMEARARRVRGGR